MRSSRNAIALRYVAFAIVAGIVNLGVQRLLLVGGHEPTQFALAIAAGTLAGLVIKYFLDKRWIFYDRERGARAHGRKFTLYVIAGIATTLVFWSTESLFWLIFQRDAWREAGAILGLAIGYVVKYRLDRRFVFSPAPRGMVA